MRFSRNSKLRQETWIGSVQFVPSLLKASVNETKMDPYVGFTCLLMLPKELNVFGTLRQVWWAEG